MTTLDFTYRLDVGTVTIAEIDGSVDFVEDGSDWSFDNWQFDGYDERGARVKIPVPDHMRDAVETWVWANCQDQIYDARMKECEAAFDSYDAAREDEWDRRRDERLNPTPT